MNPTDSEDEAFSLDDIEELLADSLPPLEEETPDDLARFTSIESMPASVPSLTVHPPEGTSIVTSDTSSGVQVRRPGSRREEDNPVAAPGEVVVDFHRLFQSFFVNWSAANTYSVLGRISRRAVLVGWRPEDLKSVELTSRIYQNIARNCPGVPEPEFDDAGQELDPDPEKICPCQQRYGANPEVWTGHPCPAETLFLFQQFTLYVRDLGIRPEDHVDVQQVMEIVKLHLYEARCDEAIQRKNGRMHDLEVGALDQRASIVYWNKRTDVALETQGILSTRRLKLYDKLIASRDSRARKKRDDAKVAAALGNASGALTAAQAMAELNRENIARRRRVQILDASEVNGNAHETTVNPTEEDILDAMFTSAEDLPHDISAS